MSNRVELVEVEKRDESKRTDEQIAASINIFQGKLYFDLIVVILVVCLFATCFFFMRQ